ncbi:hypothetical protein PHYSODRAFT_481923, partial [Phytophthora sojae]
MRGREVGEWELTSRGNTYRCNDFRWSCSCLFDSSYSLPCQHLMYIAQYVHKFEKLPASSVPPRWN